ncbi:MAG: type II secretion system F family protein [Phycisphaerales bacterium]
MPTYQYQSLNSGDGGSATIDAQDRGSAVRTLMSRGITPTRVELVTRGKQKSGAAPRARSASKGARFSLRIGNSAMSRSEMASFIGELSIAVQAGLPIVPALRTIAGQGRTEAQRQMLETIIHDVERGRSLADSMRAYGAPFSALVTNLVQAGEVSGRLGEVLGQAALLLDRDLKLRRSLTSALMYPAILTTFIVMAIVVLVTFIVPNIMNSVNLPPDQLPLPTIVVMGVAGFMTAYWWLIGIAIGFAMFFASRAYRTPSTRLRIDTVLMATPVLGRLLRDIAVARFTRTFGTLAGAGLPVIMSLKITKGTLGNKALERVMDDVCDEVSQGRTISDPLEQSGYFPPLLIQLMNLGEKTGTLDEMLLRAADAFEERTQASVKLFTQVLPPLLIVVLAGVVGFVILAVMLPLIEMQNAISGV